MNTDKETIEAEIVQTEERNELTSFLDLSSIKPRIIADNINNQLKEGFLNPLQVKLTLKKLADIVKIFDEDKESKQIILSEAEKHGKTFDMFDAKFDVCSVYTKYDYSVCNDPYLEKLYEIRDEIKELISIREKDLQGIKARTGSIEQAKRTEVIDDLPFLDWDKGQGIETEVYPPLKLQTEGVKITLKK